MIRDLEEMVPVRGGPFRMGSTDESCNRCSQVFVSEDFVKSELPQHEVHVADYRIGKYPVTNGYARFVAAMAYEAPVIEWCGFTTSLGNHPLFTYHGTMQLPIVDG
ncbi:MAG: SUMF1/EgtB/PvdO family nonheme iron enzyme [Caldilineaceae bacterium]